MEKEVHGFLDFKTFFIYEINSLVWQMPELTFQQPFELRILSRYTVYHKSCLPMKTNPILLVDDPDRSMLSPSM